MTFKEWYDKHPLWDLRLPVIETWLAQCWRDATATERERCAGIAERIGRALKVRDGSPVEWKQILDAICNER